VHEGGQTLPVPRDRPPLPVTQTPVMPALMAAETRALPRGRQQNDTQGRNPRRSPVAGVTKLAGRKGRNTEESGGSHGSKTTSTARGITDPMKEDETRALTPK